MDKGPKEIIFSREMTPDQWEEVQREILKSQVFIQDPEVNKTEAMNIFNDLLEDWHGEFICTIENFSGAITREKEMAEAKKEEYKRRFMKALGVGKWKV